MIKVQQRRRIEWIDIAKGIGILLVLFSHIVASFVRQSDSLKILKSEPIVIIGSFFMPLFFYLSGIFIKSILKKDFFTVFKQKFKRLMIPYFIWGIISVAFWGLYSRKNPIYRFLELPIRPIFVLWFVYSMFLAIILFWLLQTKLHKNIVFIISLILYIIGFAVGKYVGIDSFFKPLVALCQNFIFFDMGFLTRSRILNKYSNLKESALAIFSFVLLVLFNSIGIHSYFLKIVFQLFSAMLGILCVCSFSKLIVTIKPKVSVLSVLGQYSMQIYLIHKIVVEIFGIIIAKFTLNIIIFIIINMIMTLLSSFIIIKIIDKFRVNNIFFGVS